MSISSEITRINTNIANAYTKVSEKGGTLPATQNSANLADAIDTITGGSPALLQTKSVSVTQNGTQTITADSGYDGLAQVNLDVNVDRNAKIKSVITDIDLRKSIITFDLIDTSNITNMLDMFYRYTSLTTIPLIQTSQVTNMQEMFCGCTSLTSIPLLNTSSVTNMHTMFLNCSALTSIPQIDTSEVTTMQEMFNGCSVLTTVPVLDTSKVKNMNYIFYRCNNLTDESLNNILTMCANATSFTSTKTLSYLGLNSSQVTKCTTLSNWAAAQAAGWTTGY